MKRKVKFQEGGMVETPSQRRVRLADRNRDRAAEFRAAQDREVARRAAAQADVARFNERMNRAMPITPDEARRLGAESAQRPANPRPNIAARVPAAAGAVARGASRAIPGMNVIRGVTPTSLEAGAEFEREGLAQAREEARMRDRAAAEQELAEAPQRIPTPRPTPASRPRPAAAREISADRLNDLMMGAEPANAEERLAQMRMQGRRQELEERGTAFKKGGMIGKPKVAPKKMMKGGIVAKPKSKAKPAGKPMPFKKGGAIKKGRK